MVSNPSIRNHTVVQMSRNSRGQYVMGHNGGPGRPRGSRNRLSEQFIADLQADWEQHGADVIVASRKLDACQAVGAGHCRSALVRHHDSPSDPAQFSPPWDRRGRHCRLAAVHRHCWLQRQ